MLKIIDFILEEYFIHYNRLKDKKNIFTVFDMLIVAVLMFPAAIVVNLNKIIPFITRYYPFSLLFRDKLLHYKYTREREMANYIENKLNRLKKPFHVRGVSFDRFFVTFHGYFLKKPAGSMEKLLREIVETKLKMEMGEVYVRDMDKNKVRILIPKENLNHYNIPASEV